MNLITSASIFHLMTTYIKLYLTYQLYEIWRRISLPNMREEGWNLGQYRKTARGG